MKRLVVSVAAALVGLAACTSGGGVESSAVGPGTAVTSSAGPAPEGTIAFNKGTAEGIAVYTMNLDGSNEQRVREVGDFVTLSPDGSRFLGALPTPDGRIGPETFNLDGSGYALLPIADPTLQVAGGVWSPDGEQIVGGAWDDTDPSRQGLYAYGSVDGSGLRRLTEPGDPNDYPVAYSPDGSRVLFTREVKPYDHSGPMDVFVVQDDGEDLVRLNPPGTTSGAMSYSSGWSPDGRLVTFVASKGSFWEDPRAVFVVNADGTDVRRITPWNETLGARWSPDGKWIAFDMSGAGGPRDLFIVHTDGTERTQITSSEDGQLSFDPAWSPDSTKLLFLRRDGDAAGLYDVADLWTVNVDGTELSQVTHSPAEYSGYAWLPLNK